MNRLTHREGGDESSTETSSRVRRLGLASSVLIMSLTLSSCGDESSSDKDEHVRLDLPCKSVGYQTVPYDIESGELVKLSKNIKSSQFDGPWRDHPCFDEALEEAKKQTLDGYPYDGDVIFPKFLVPKGTSLQEVKQANR